MKAAPPVAGPLLDRFDKICVSLSILHERMFNFRCHAGGRPGPPVYAIDGMIVCTYCSTIDVKRGNHMKIGPLLGRLLCLVAIILSAKAAAAESTRQLDAQASSGTPNAALTASRLSSAKKKYNPNALRRLDFRIVGKSCPVCLMGVQNRVRGLDGTVEVAVMLKKPYGASVIYDSKQVDEQKILTTAKLTEPLIKLEDIQDAAIEKLPVVLIPPHAGMPSTSMDDSGSQTVSP
jgi:copper chaperone CopZ